MRRPAFLVVLLVLATAPAVAQDLGDVWGDPGDRRPPEPTRADPPVEPEQVVPDPAELARQRAFDRGLERASEAAQREAELERLRRHAPFELDWGLR